jgi:RNA polymerase sigma factor (sigma-70 family)
MEGTKHADRMDGQVVRQRFQADDETVLTEINGSQSDVVVKALIRAYALQSQDAAAIFNLALQELWEKRLCYDPERASIGVFLFTIASRRAVDHLRAEKRRDDRVPITLLPDLSRVTARPHSSPSSEAAEPSAQCKAILVAYDALPPVYREILRLDMAADGVASSKFVCQVTGIPQVQVPVYRRRARERLKKLLEESGTLNLPKEGQDPRPE